MRTSILRITILLHLPIVSALCDDPSSVAKPNQTVVASTAFPADIPEADRLTQEYMAERAKWVAVREEARRESAKAKEPGDRRRIRQKFEKQERDLRASTASLAKKLKEAEKAKRASSRPTQPQPSN